MITPVISVPDAATVLDACEFFTLHRLLAFPVVDALGGLVGLVDVDPYADEMEDLEHRQEGHDLFQLVGVYPTEAELRRVGLAARSGISAGATSIKLRSEGPSRNGPARVVTNATHPESMGGLQLLLLLKQCGVGGALRQFGVEPQVPTAGVGSRAQPVGVDERAGASRRPTTPAWPGGNQPRHSGSGIRYRVRVDSHRHPVEHQGRWKQSARLTVLPCACTSPAGSCTEGLR